MIFSLFSKSFHQCDPRERDRLKMITFLLFIRSKMIFIIYLIILGAGVPPTQMMNMDR